MPTTSSHEHSSMCCPLQLFANAAGKETDSDVEWMGGGGGGGG